MVQKHKGSHNSIYSEHNVLNLELLSDYPELFTDVLIDLRDIQTETQLQVGKQELITLFQQALQNNMGDSNAVQLIHSKVAPTGNKQYFKGV